MRFLTLAASGKAREAFRAYCGPSFRHHNPYFRSDADSLVTAMDENAKENPEKLLEPQHVLEDGDLVAVHSRVRHHPGELGFGTVHIFRFDGDRIVELWDVAQQVPEDSPNEDGMF